MIRRTALFFGLFTLAATSHVDASASGDSTITVRDLRTEHIAEPLGLQSEHPRLRWLLESSARGQRQVAYQILVASSPEKLQADIADKWDSGKVASDNSVEVPYAGTALASGERSYWKIRIWDQDDRSSLYSAPAFFEIGLTGASDWKGKWITAAKDISSPLFRRDFAIQGHVRRARAYVSGLGYYELYINGRKIGDRVLDPAPTRFRNDESYKLGARVLYSTYDVTDEIASGVNTAGVMLGHGWYSVDADHSRRTPYGDRPRILVQINVELDDGRVLSVATDSSWKYSAGPITYNDISHGETYDATKRQEGWSRAGFNDASWQAAEIAEMPVGKLVAQTLPANRVMDTLPAQKIITPREAEFFDGKRIYDFGQNFSGWVRIAVTGPRGATLVLRYGAKLFPEDDTLDTRSNEPPQAEAHQRDTYILSGTGTEIWEPRFTLHGFRYVEVSGDTDRVTIEQIEGRFVHSSVAATGSFHSSNELLNRIHHNIQWTFMSSLQGIPQDAADRNERVGWLGDPAFVAEDYLHNFEMVGFWEKWLNDMQDSQRDNGNIAVASPTHSPAAYVDWPCWTVTYPLVVWYSYQYYGDTHVLEQHYESLKKLLAYTSTLAKDNIITSGLGDHMEPQDEGFTHFWPLQTPPALTSTAYYYEETRILGRIAAVLGRRSDAQSYERMGNGIKDAFNRRFLNIATNQYATGSQTSNALALYLDLVPPDRTAAVLNNLIDDIRHTHNVHLSTGIIGSNAVAHTLPERGAHLLMYQLSTQTTYPSLGEQVLKGATTVCETYECGPWLSQNMKMFGSLDKFFYRDLAGITPESPGYRTVRISPQPVGDLLRVTASQQTVRGAVTVDWLRGDASFDMKIEIPAGMEADVHIPTMNLMNVQISEGGTPLWGSNGYIAGIPGIRTAAADSDSVAIRVGSGSYRFKLSGTGF